MSRKKEMFGFLPLCLGLSVFVLLTSCATTPPAFSTIQQAQDRIAQAEAMQVVQATAAADLNAARERLEIAKLMVKQFEYEDAYDIAQESLVLADLAILRTKLAASTEAVKEAKARMEQLPASSDMAQNHGVEEIGR